MLLKLDHLTHSELIEDADSSTWRSLHYLNLYRIVLAGIFVASIFVEKHLSVLGAFDPVAFAIVSYGYLSIAALASFSIHWRWPSFEVNVTLLTMVDICALTIIMHTSGGLESGLGMLIVVAIAGNSLLTNGKAASLFAALAALAILTGQVVAHISQSMEPDYTQAGFLGAAVFATALLSHVLSKKLRETEQLAEQRGVDLANMALLNEHVIKRMQSGVIVVDNDNRIRLMNKAAWHMLGLPVIENHQYKTLNSLSKELYDLLETWKRNPHSDPNLFRTNGSGTDVLPSFTQFGSGDNRATLIILEDTLRMTQQAQQMKLASLGRLTASIAHEIRNPLGAISHADQLLAESSNLDQNQRRLTEIIHTHTKRVNGIIENVLQLSRRDNTIPENINLKSWIAKFIDDFVMAENLNPDNVSSNIQPDNLTVYFDPTQLQQVVWNLSQNGLRYSIDYEKNPKLELHVGLMENTKRAHLDIIDHGPGIEPKIVEQIFEPFFTTDSKGTGLGLYIARELCELNKAQIKHIPVSDGGCCFRIEFAGKINES
jgi:two-component system sensor histidine kinase PilS (NtrC family)